MKLKQRIADWMFEHTSLPNVVRKCPERSNLWFLKGNCVVCVANPYEKTPDGKFTSDFPSDHTLTLGYEKIQLCEYHAKQLASVMHRFVDKT